MVLWKDCVIWRFFTYCLFILALFGSCVLCSGEYQRKMYSLFLWSARQTYWKSTVSGYGLVFSSFFPIHLQVSSVSFFLDKGEQKERMGKSSSKVALSLYNYVIFNLMSMKYPPPGCAEVLLNTVYKNTSSPRVTQ